MAHAIHATQLAIQDIVDATPFLKWAGGKNQIFEQLRPFFPTKFENYFEPFVGSAAVFFNLRRIHGQFSATLMDRNADLINCYQMIRDELQKLILSLESHKHKHSEKHYYRIRDVDPAKLLLVERAARFIYLNKTCYNGLYRVNKTISSISIRRITQKIRGSPATPSLLFPVQQDFKLTNTHNYETS